MEREFSAGKSGGKSVGGNARGLMHVCLKCIGFLVVGLKGFGKIEIRIFLYVILYVI